MVVSCLGGTPFEVPSTCTRWPTVYGVPLFEVRPRDNSIVEGCFIGCYFPHACRAICPTLGIVVIGMKQLAQGVCVRLSFPCFCRIYARRVFYLVLHSLKWCFAGCDRSSKLYCTALLQFCSWRENECFIKGSVCSIFHGSYQSLNLLSTERKG